MKLKHHAVVLGTTRTGKTTTALKLLTEQKGLKIFINTKREKKWFKYMKYAVYHEGNMETIYDHFDSYSDGIIQYIPDATNKASLAELEKILDVVLKRQQENDERRTTIVVDEIQVYQSAHGCNETLARLWTMGLGLNIVSIAVAQRPQMIHFDLLANTENWLLHAITPFDLDYLKKDKGVLNFDEYPEFQVKGEIIPHTCYAQYNKMTGIKKLW